MKKQASKHEYKFKQQRTLKKEVELAKAEGREVPSEQSKTTLKQPRIIHRSKPSTAGGIPSMSKPKKEGSRSRSRDVQKKTFGLARPANKTPVKAEGEGV